MLVPTVTPSPERTAVATPFESVVAEVTASTPAVAAKLTVAPDTATLLEFLAVTVMAAVVLPSGGTEAALLATISVLTPGLPAVDTAITVLPETDPTVAVTVTLVPALTPDTLKVVVACPLVLVVAVELPKVPEEVLNVTVAPETTVPDEEVATAVMVTAVVEPACTVEALLLTARADVVGDVVVVVPPLSNPLPPQALSESAAIPATIMDANLRCSLT